MLNSGARSLATGKSASDMTQIRLISIVRQCLA